jgi:hypothetical protein
MVDRRPDPSGRDVGVALIEHLWAIPLRGLFTRPGTGPLPTRGSIRMTPCSGGLE